MRWIALFVRDITSGLHLRKDHRVDLGLSLLRSELLTGHIRAVYVSHRIRSRRRVILSLGSGCGNLFAGHPALFDWDKAVSRCYFSLHQALTQTLGSLDISFTAISARGVL